MRPDDTVQRGPDGGGTRDLIFGEVGHYKKTAYDIPVFAGVDRMCDKYPDKPALLYLGETWTYAELKELVERFATALHGLGVRPGDKVMIYIPNCPQFLAAWFGTQKIGAVPVPVAPIYTHFELEYLLNDSGSETIVCQDTNFSYVEQVLPKTDLKRVIVINYAELLPWWKRLAGRLFDKIPDGVIKKNSHVFFFKNLIKAYPPRPPEVEIDPRADLSRILYTGGTTGFPKGVLTNHTAVVSGITDAMEIAGAKVGEGGEDTLIMVNPLFHELAQLFTLAWGLTRGNLVILLPIPDVDMILHIIQNYGVSLFVGVPTLYRMILENDRLDLYNCSTLKFCLSGADKLPLEIFNRWEERFGVPIWQGYGATEVGWVTAAPLDREPEPESIGLPLPSREVIILDPDTSEPVPQGKVGEIFVHCDYTFKHYLNKPEETKKSYISFEGRLWYRTNDFGKLGNDGQLYFVDRSADIIKYKGYRVSASEIEAVLQDHPAVIAACVVGVPDIRAGERIKGIVVLKEDVRGVSSADLLAFCRQRLSAYKIPKYIEFRDMLPKSKVGKLLRREIRDEERRKSTKGKEE